MSKPNRRKDYFVKKWLQSRLIIYFLIILSLGSIALAAIIYSQSLAAIRRIMFWGHSTYVSTWEVLRPGILSTNVTVTLVVIGLAVAVTLLISWAVARAARVVTRNIRSSITGQDPEGWLPVPRPREFQHFQQALAEGLREHKDRVEGLRRACADLEAKVREAREKGKKEGQGPDHALLRDLHTSYQDLRNLYRSFKLE